MRAFHRCALRVGLLVALVTVLTGGVSAQGTPIVEPGYDPLAIGKAAVVLRNFAGGSGHEVFLGGPVGAGEESPTGTKGELPGTWPATSHVTFRYDGAGTIRASAQGTAGLGEYAFVVGNLGTVNYIRISVVVLAADTTVSLDNVTLGSASLGSFPGEPGKYRNWHVHGVDLSAGFSLEGDIVLSGAQPTGGDNRVVIEAGYLGPAYAFSGFYEPITMGATNVANAGRAIPVKWRLTDSTGAPVADTASFVGLYSYPVSCDALAGSVTDAVGEADEVAAGSSGLQYNGDGYWQYNWKTPKEYAGTCRAMYVQCADGLTSPTVSFSYK